VPDVRSRLEAARLWLDQSFGRPAQSEEPLTPRMPATTAEVERMSWKEMQAVFAASWVDEIAAVQREGGEALVRERVERLSEGEKRIHREALAEPG
jgi:hypothetical protein